MECNKEEAIRAREIAQKKMENQDFAGARKIALKSQRLYPDLENINQLICVCDVHCSAENKKLGNERDWYDILKVEQSADEMLIKKQYRKLALLLHPDKNKFSGAEAAFMLIGEAQKVLLDKDKRVVYDARYRRFFQNAAPNPPPKENKNAKDMKRPSGKNNMTKTGSSHAKKKPQQQADPVDPSGTETFWTVCPFCSVRYRYRKTALDKNLKCQTCKKAFIAYDMCANSKRGSKVNQTETSAQTGVQANSGQQPSGSNASQAAACAKAGVSNKGGSSGGTQAGKSNKTNELNTGAKRRASSGGCNHTEVKVVKKGKTQEAVEKAGGTVTTKEKSQASAGKTGDTVTEKEKNHASAGKTGGTAGDKEKKKQASVGKKGDTVTKKEKNQESAGKTGDTVTTKEKNQASAGKTGDAVTEKEKNHVSAGKKGDTVTKKEKNQASAGKTGDTVTTKEKNQASAGKTGDTVTTKEKIQASAGKTGDTVTEKEKNQAPAGKTGDTVTKREKQVSAEKAVDEVAKRAKKEVTDTLAGSRQSKRRVSDTEIGGGEETLNSLKKHKGNAEVGSTEFKQPPDESHCVTQTQHVPNKDIDLTQPQHVPDNDFNDFDQIRQESSFKANQIWAVYDIVDTMPRFYAIIKRVFSGGSKLRITWLDPAPDEKDARSDLPISCGKFVPGNSEITEDILMFSHPIRWEKSKGKNSFIKIYPQKGETWALFRDWRTHNSSRKFEFEFVEILSDYDETVGIRVAVLRKLKGFSALFCREGRDEEIHIPPNECFRFSHRVPSFIMTGEEGKGVPKGSFELDLASLPLENLTCNDVEPCERPEPEFFNFDATRDLVRFKVDQVWALYNDEDGLPKCYGLIKRVYLESPVKLKIAWLNKEIPNCCGKFKITNRKLQGFYDASPFSHELQAEKIKPGVFEIYPKNGQIWALNSDLENCDYDVVEIVEQSVKGSPTKVLVLEKVSGYNSVFKVKSSSSTMEIPCNELLRFSHQIPAHVLTDEKEGSLRGFKELDPSALPLSLFLPKVR